MAHFAKIENNIVTQIVVVANTDCAGGQYPESESVGVSFLAACGMAGDWKQTSYNGNFRGCYAGIGYAYNADLDEFVPPVVELQE
jgi:hypothetical protein